MGTKIFLCNVDTGEYKDKKKETIKHQLSIKVREGIYNIKNRNKN
jgi:hypothetical protein